MALPFQGGTYGEVRTDPADGLEYRYVGPERDASEANTGWVANDSFALSNIANQFPPDFGLVTDAKVGDVRIDKYTGTEFRFNGIGWVVTYPTVVDVGKYDKIRFNQILGK